jgi:hypothetical protein
MEAEKREGGEVKVVAGGVVSVGDVGGGDGASAADLVTGVDALAGSEVTDPPA